ncbi:Mov34-domain-containing protein [Cutaneotrichosporon oleaginosum]|uniref:Eukaryotic translation initiation factor 3 subunit F n=1 Tax=Cutaneotrichosporon oleaginosum TaxID=879819 RepID=A0A0J1B9T3_9TREE|nr:Mov34-domain-containing protein [Cutaneotrichosporon oleaginosum]KLT44619.1 Mov34-domain-containing protein [Cutaneotrichosporon oleaginosum]TXT13866.1 hypothetical protein COLE_00059 [Cutaneotrichosporon oleaginosum]
MSLDAPTSAIHLSQPPSGSSHLRPPALITVHPSVIASILTHHQRRPADSTAPRVIGTLLGVRSENGQEIDVRSSFAVPHSEGEEQVALDMPFQQGMMELLSKNGIKESIVGWYATHPELNAYSALIQNYFSQETGASQAIHLTVDTDLDASGKKGLGIKGWVSTSLGLNPKPENCVFLPVPVVIKYADSERAGLDLLTSGNPTPSPSLPPLPSLSSSLSQLSTLIDDALKYVQAVNAGQTSGDAEVGRYLLEGVGRWSAGAGSNADEGGIKEGLQDTLTVSYLSNLVRAQVELAGRLALLPQSQQ